MVDLLGLPATGNALTRSEPVSWQQLDKLSLGSNQFGDPSPTPIQLAGQHLSSIAASHAALEKKGIALPDIEAKDTTTFILRIFRDAAEQVANGTKLEAARKAAEDLKIIDAIIAGDEDAKTRRISSTTVAVFIGKIDELGGIAGGLNNLAKSVHLKPGNVLNALAPLRARMQAFAAGPAPV